MDPLSYVSRLTKNKSLPASQESGFSYEMIAIGVFVFIYVIIRLTESYLLPMIPEFFRTEISAIFRWSPVLVPIIFGLTYMRPGKTESNTVSWQSERERFTGVTSDDTLKRRMRAIWSK